MWGVFDRLLTATVLLEKRLLRHVALFRPGLDDVRGRLPVCVGTGPRLGAGAYWDWHAAVFDEQDDRNTGWAGTENLLEITASVDGVDAEALETCLDERRDELEADVDADADLAQSLEVRGTPTFDVVNRETDATGRLVGAQPPERFADAIERIEDAYSSH